jgi:cytochrome c oxidase accessory protein FixG
MPEDIQYFKKRTKLYPKRVWGKYRKLKWLAMVVLLSIYYFVPWIRWDRGPNVPDQAVLIDMPARRAYFFFIEIWPQEIYYITGILVLAAIGLFFVTSLLGRVWCGYACPQTVWTDLFIWVERIVQGDRNNRMRIDKLGFFSFERLWKKAITHSIWLLIGLFTGGAWVFYFNDAPTLLDQLVNFDVPFSTWVWILGLTFSTYLMAGFAREQVCTYMCPYSRFQSAMFDKDTLIITYDEKRGEPRGAHKAGTSWEGKGHCIDCTQCIVVCPQGIDIRNGLQMECIACGLCIDACNNVMEKIGLPKGLIKYDTTNGIKNKLHLVRPRTIYYAIIILVLSCIMVYGLINKSNLELHALHDRNPLFVMLSNGKIRNSYTIKILNKSHEDKVYTLNIKGIDNFEMKVEGTGEISYDNMPVFVDSVGQFRVYLSADKSLFKESRNNIEFEIIDNKTLQKQITKSIFIIPNLN